MVRKMGPTAEPERLRTAYSIPPRCSSNDDDDDDDHVNSSIATVFKGKDLVVLVAGRSTSNSAFKAA